MTVRAGLALALALMLLAASGAGAASAPVLTIAAPNPELAAYVRAAARRAGPRLLALTGAAPARIKIIIAGGREEFQRRVKKLGGPIWAAGVAAKGLIVLLPPAQLTDPDDFESLLTHELSHLYLAAALGSRRPPLWLEEGVAMYAAGQGGWRLVGTMTRAVLAKKLFTLVELSRKFPLGGDQAAAAYAQSYYFVSYLLSENGPQTIARLLKLLARGRDLTEALHRVTGRGLAACEREFRAAMESRFSWLALGAAGGTLWALISLGAGAALVWRRRAHLAQRGGMDGPQAPPPGPDARRWPPPPPRGDVLASAGLAPPARKKENQPGEES